MQNAGVTLEMRVSEILMLNDYHNCNITQFHLGFCYLHWQEQQVLNLR